MILALDHATWIGARRDMAEADVVRDVVEERDALANEHRQTTDDQSVDEADSQKLLDCDPTIYVEMAGTGSCELGNYLCRRSG